MFFVQFASCRKGDHFVPFDFPVDCLDSEASLKQNEQWTFIKIILISLDSVHTQKHNLVLFRLVYFSTITMGLKSHTHMVHCIQRNIKSSFSHLTLITSIHLNIKTIMYNQVSCRSTESFCTHHAIISQFRYIFKVGQVLSKT